MDQKKTVTKKSKSSVSGKLLAVLIPMVSVAIMIIMLIVATQARKIIVELAKSNLEGEANYYAQKISREITNLTEFLDANAETLQTVRFDSDKAMADYLTPTLTKSSYIPNGMYVATSDGAWIDPSGWEPEPGYDATTRDWYIEGTGHTSFALGEPYVDESTGGMVVSFSRTVNIPDGRSGVAAADYALDGIVEEIGSIKPLKTGGAMLLSNDKILSYFTTEFNGSSVNEHADDVFLNAAYNLATSGSEEVAELKSQNGMTYYVVAKTVPGTEWKLITSVSKNDVLAELNRFQVVCIIIMLIMIVIISLIMFRLITLMVSKPVGLLTENITKIADGDFTVQIPSGGNDEIGLMNNSMKEFVDQMRGTLGDIQSETNKLATEAENSKDASGKLNIEATEQSSNMGQIKDAMDGMAAAVQELAENATELANEVSDLMEQGKSTGETVSVLVEKAKNGQRDMDHVKAGMESVANAMTEMNEDVQAVGVSAEKINSIIEMISSIAEQTNLLSLNASIEAARAGEAGKGFAVVATEIGQLANNSAESTTEIADIIKDITAQIRSLSEKSEANMKEIENSSEAVDVAGKTFEEIFENLDITSATVSEMIDKIGNVDTIATSVAAISQEQSASTQEVTATTDNLAASAREVANESRGVDESATTVSSAAATIEDFVKTFRI